MKPFIVNKDSWHYKFNEVMNLSVVYTVEETTKDFCSYWRNTVWNFVKALLIVVLASIAIGMLGLAIYEIILAYMAGEFRIIDVLIGFVGFMAVLFLSIFYVVPTVSKFVWYKLRLEVVGKWVYDYILTPIGNGLLRVGFYFLEVKDWIVDKLPEQKEKPVRKPKPKKESLLRLKYRAFKENFCPMVEYKEVSND